MQINTKKKESNGDVKYKAEPNPFLVGKLKNDKGFVLEAHS